MAKSANKFGAVKVGRDGFVFDSKKEAKRYGELRLLERAGEISALEVHRRFVILPAFADEREWAYTCDFAYVQDGRQVVEDVKSKPTAKRRDFVLTRKAFKAKFPQIEFRTVI